MMSTFDPHAERPWSAEEDKQLRNAVLQEKEQSRPVKWDAIAASLPRRSKKECRKRWHHTMMEAVRKCQWKSEEDERLSGAVQKYGENWTSVARVVMTRNDNECMRRWNELQNQNTNANPSSPPSNLWNFEEFNRIHPHRASVGSSVSSADFHHDISPYSSPYGTLSDPMVDEILRDIGHMSPHNAQYESMDIDPSGMHSVSPPTTIDPRQASMHQENLDAFIDFDAERSGNSFDARHTTPANGQQFDSSDWSWFDSMVTASGGRSQYQPHHHNGHPAGPGGFLVDTHPSELTHDSPGALDSGPSSYSSSRSGSLTPPTQQVPNPEVMDFYSLSNQNFLPLKASTGGARVVIVCKSNDSRTLSSLDNIMRTLKANGHSVIQESQPIGGNDYLCGSLAIDDVLQDLC